MKWSFPKIFKLSSNGIFIFMEKFLGMMTLIHKTFIGYRPIFILFILLCFGCRKEVSDYVYDKPNQLVVNAILESGKPAHLTLSAVAYLHDTAFTNIGGADIEILKDGLHKANMVESSTGHYFSDIIPEPDNTIQFNINTVDFGRIMVTDTMPSTPIVLNYSHENIAGVDEEGITIPGINIDFMTSHPGTHYVYVRLRSLQRDMERDCEIVDIDDPLLLKEGLPIPLFTLENPSPSSYHISLKYTTGSSDLTSTKLYPLIVEVSFISRAYYRFLKSVHFYEKGRFDQGIGVTNTPYNLYSNVTGGLGIVGCANTIQLDTIFP